MKIEIDVLDHGFVKVVDWMGSDDSVVRSARVSYGSGTKTVRQDERLISYLMRNEHMTPFESPTIQFHIKAPIFVARQWMRHRQGSFNESSARYSVVDEEWYSPPLERFQFQSKTNKQGSFGALPATEAHALKFFMGENAQRAFDLYNKMLEDGLSREVARIILPVSTYTEFYWKVDLRNLLHFLKLRNDSHAQWEIQQYAQVIEEIVSGWCPVSYEAWKESCDAVKKDSGN